MKNIEEKSMEKERDMVVEVQYDGTGGWTISYPRKGQFRFGPKDTHKFKLTDVYDLRAMLQIIKQINMPESNTQMYMDKGDRVQPHKYKHRFTIVKGKEKIPEALLKYTYRINDVVTEEEEEAILALCPKFFETETRRKK